MKNLKDKVVLVTGAGSGIGRASAVAFAREQSTLVITDIDDSSLQETAELVRAQGRDVLAERADISKRDEVKALCDRAVETFGRVDVLINNAGVALYAELVDTDLEDWEWVMGVNLWGTVYTLHELLPGMVKRRSGHIVNVASWVGLLGQPANSAYAASKFGVVGLTESVRAEVGRFGIGVSCVCPGIVKTNIFKALKLKGYKDDVRKMPSFLGKTPEQFAQLIVRAVKKNQALVLADLAWITFAMKRLSPTLGRQIGRGGVHVFGRHKIQPGPDTGT